MAVFKFVINQGPLAYQVEKDQKDAPVLGKKISDKINGDFLRLEGYELEITGGSDKDGFPMRKDIEGIKRSKIIITHGIGYKGEEGVRKRVSLRGNTISSEISQINCKIVKAGPKKLEEIIPKKEKKQ